MTCSSCSNVVERPDVPHVVRPCPQCGRLLKIHEPGKHGIGFRIKKGDRPVIPAGFIQPSLNPLKSSGRLSRHGLNWLAKKVHLGNLLSTRDDAWKEVDLLHQQCTEILSASDLLAGLDLEDEAQSIEAFGILEATPDCSEWWAFLTGMLLSLLRDAAARNEVDQAIWAIACAERCRSMLIFKQHLEEAVWMGQSAKRIVDILRIWDNNKTNADEGFWQTTFNENVYALSQIFAVPLVFIKESAYVGGMKINRRDARLVDYLFAMESSREAVLVEIKTPATKLLGAKYRGTYRPSQEMTGALMQVLDYRDVLIRSIREDLGSPEIRPSSPRALLIAGNGTAELEENSKRAAFERLRATLKDVEIVTYDELFRKIEVLASLFNITRNNEGSATAGHSPEGASG